MTFCSPFPLTAVASSRKKQKEGIEVDIVRAKDGKKQCEKEAEMMRMGWTRVNVHLCLCPLLLSPDLHLLLLSLLAVSFLTSLNLWAHFSLDLSAEVDTDHTLPVGSSGRYECGKGLAVSNETPSVRFLKTHSVVCLQQH